MKSACRDDYGTPDNIVVREMPRPSPGLHDVIVKVYATTINRTDCGVLSGRPMVFRLFVGFPRPRFPVLGTDFAGTVVEVGTKNNLWKVGDRVMGFSDNGLPTQAEFVSISPRIAMNAIPAGISFASAVASIEGFHYALNFISKVRVTPNQHILVIGGTGAIGSAMIQILKDSECMVTAVCRKIDFPKVLSLGADRAVDYVDSDFSQSLAGERFAHVFDAVGKSTFGVCRQLMARQGIYSSSELGPNGQNLLLALTTQMRPGQKVIFPVPVDIPRTLRYAAKLLTQGKFTPLIDRTFSFDDIADAYRYAASGQKIGNLILRVAD